MLSVVVEQAFRLSRLSFVSVFSRGCVVRDCFRHCRVGVVNPAVEDVNAGDVPLGVKSTVIKKKENLS